MKKLTFVGHVLFGLSIIGLGMLCIVYNDYIIGRPPQWQLNLIMVYFITTLITISAIAVIIEKKGYEASLLIAALLLIFSVGKHIPVFMSDWLNTYKSLALMGGALIAAASFRDKFANLFLWTGYLTLSLFFISAGYAHIKFAAFVRDFIPAYIPFRGFFTYFTAGCLMAGGLGLLVPFTRKWAAFFSGLMTGGWFLLLHIPRLIANPTDAGERMGLFESLAFAGIFFILTGSAAKKNSD